MGRENRNQMREQRRRETAGDTKEGEINMWTGLSKMERKMREEKAGK